MTIRAIYENGVFRPTEPVEIPDHSRVILHAEVESRPDHQDLADSAAIWNVLATSQEANNPLLAERHNEHQP